jgi:hypothetical protein
MNGYTPGGLALLLAGAAGQILVWIGVAVAAALVLFGIYLGIRAGIRFFRLVSSSGGTWRMSRAEFDAMEARDDAQYAADVALIESDWTAYDDGGEAAFKSDIMGLAFEDGHDVEAADRIARRAWKDYKGL